MDYGNKTKGREMSGLTEAECASNRANERVFLTVDLEDYRSIVRRNLGLAPVSTGNEIERGVDALLDCVERVRPSERITFFTTGQLAAALPELVKRLASMGHEIACHSHDHRDLRLLSRTDFRSDLDRATSQLEDVSGNKVLGFRAPSFSVPHDRYWMFEVLKERGYLYDSSIVSSTPRVSSDPFDRVELDSGQLYELPVFRYDALRVARVRALGGTYFRALPLGLSERILQLAAMSGYPRCVWLHASDVYSLPTYGFTEAFGISPRDGAFWPVHTLRDCIGRRGALGKLQRMLGHLELAGTVGEAALRMRTKQPGRPRA